MEVTRNDLRSYLKLKRQREYHKNKIKDLKTKLTSIKSPQITDDPAGGERKLLDDKLVEIETYELKLTQIERSMMEIESAISGVINESHREILKLHYIDGISALEIGLKKGHCESTVYKMMAEMFILKLG